MITHRIFATCLHNFELYSFKILIPEGGMLPPRDKTLVLQNWNLRSSTSTWGPWNKVEVTLLTGVIVTMNKKNLSCCNTGRAGRTLLAYSLGFLLILLSPILRIDGKLHQTKKKKRKAHWRSKREGLAIYLTMNPEQLRAKETCREWQKKEVINIIYSLRTDKNEGCVQQTN